MKHSLWDKKTTGNKSEEGRKKYRRSSIGDIGIGQVLTKYLWLLGLVPLCLIMIPQSWLFWTNLGGSGRLTWTNKTSGWGFANRRWWQNEEQANDTLLGWRRMCQLDILRCARGLGGGLPWSSVKVWIGHLDAERYEGKSLASVCYDISTSRDNVLTKKLPSRTTLRWINYHDKYH